jgi:hypothetical protein
MVLVMTNHFQLKEFQFKNNNIQDRRSLLIMGNDSFTKEEDMESGYISLGEVDNKDNIKDNNNTALLEASQYGGNMDTLDDLVKDQEVAEGLPQFHQNRRYSAGDQNYY